MSLEKEDLDDSWREIARAAYADMLHDSERNIKYELAIAKVIRSQKSQGIEVTTLDIGTGTGLLSMIAARHGAASVQSCEAFEPMARCAVEVIQDNGYGDKINVIPKTSTNLKIGEDLPKRANLVVAELYDTELIGEGAIPSYNHAKQTLLEENFISVPARATVYAQLVTCELALKWNRPQRIKVGENFIEPPPEALTCDGAAAVHDIQMAQLDPSSFKPISEPVEVFHFDWMSKEPTPSYDHTCISVTPIASGIVHAIFFWWSTDMDPEGEIVLSCAPPWAHPEGGSDKMPWRDHWMQAIYYIPEEVEVRGSGDIIYLDSYHDEFSLWFSIEREKRAEARAKKIQRPICSCFLHLAFSRTRLGLLNDEERNSKFVSLLKRHLFPGATVLTLGDGCLLGLIAANLDANVTALEGTTMCRKVLERYVERNDLQEKAKVLGKTAEEFARFVKLEKIDLVIAEPFYESSVLPWENMRFWEEVQKLSHILPVSAQIFPSKMKVRAVGVRFHDLHKIQVPVVETCGLSMKCFDELIQSASLFSDEKVEPHPLWEYPCTALTQPHDIVELVLSRERQIVKEVKSGELTIEVSEEINGVALWCEWEFDSETGISTGPVSEVTPGEEIRWNVHYKQGCFFFRKPRKAPVGQKLVCFVEDSDDHLRFDFEVSDQV